MNCCICLSLFGLLQKSTIDWLPYRQQNLILIVQYAEKLGTKLLTDLVSSEGPLPGDKQQSLVVCPHVEEGHCLKCSL
jgi:hypothetical protein